MKNFIFKLLLLAIVVGFVTEKSAAQCIKKDGKFVQVNGSPCPNTILTAVPFLRIISDARSGALGDAGIAISADANSIEFNDSKMVLAENDLGVSVTYTPWLRSLGLTDVYLAYLSAYYKIDKFQALGFGLRYFSLGTIPFTNTEGEPQGQGNPNEFEIKASYSRKLSENLSAGLGVKFIYSNLAKNTNVDGVDIDAGRSGAADLSLTYYKPLKQLGNKSSLTVATAITNLGSKITYTNQANKAKDYLPANIGLGAALKWDMDEYNSLTFITDINKLLVPSPPLDTASAVIDPNGNGIPDFKEGSPISAAFKSFGDAPGGGAEELRELMFSFGLEYWYDEQFAVRAGYYYEDATKGNRKYLTLGVGVKYNIFGLNFSYLVPTNNQNNPLDNTLRFSLLFDFGAFGESE